MIRFMVDIAVITNDKDDIRKKTRCLQEVGTLEQIDQPVYYYI